MARFRITAAISREFANAEVENPNLNPVDPVD
jgi:hypothetical protein